MELEWDAETVKGSEMDGEEVVANEKWVGAENV
jgi:hypothetical protein